MEIQLGNGLMWDTASPLAEQSFEVQGLIASITASVQPERLREDCLGSFHRTTQRRYRISDEFTYQVDIEYNTGPMEPEFMGMKDIHYSIIQTAQ